MSTGSNMPQAGKPNLQNMAPPEESLGEQGLVIETPPDSCQLQADAVGAAGEEVNQAMIKLRDRLRALRWCRESQAAARSQPVEGFERVEDSIGAVASLIERAVSRSGQLVAEMNTLAGIDK